MTDPDPTIREATPDDELGVRRVLDAAMLETDAVPAAIDRDDVVVAVRDDRVLGVCVLVPPETVEAGRPVDSEAPIADTADGGGAHVDAVAVRRRRRGEGIGAALVEAALRREGRLTAAFDPDVRPFYESLGFTIEGGDDRLWGVATGDGR